MLSSLLHTLEEAGRSSGSSTSTSDREPFMSRCEAEAQRREVLTLVLQGCVGATGSDALDVMEHVAEVRHLLIDVVDSAGTQCNARTFVVTSPCLLHALISLHCSTPLRVCALFVDQNRCRATSWAARSTTRRRTAS